MTKYVKIGKYEIKDVNSSRIIKLNDIGMKFFEIFEMNLSIDEAVSLLAKYFEVDRETIDKDYREFFDKITNISDIWEGDFPEENYMVLEPTNECDGHCIHCFLKNSYSYSWSQENINEIINYLLENKIKYVSITGGEIFSPHYYENAVYLINKLKEKEIRIVSVSTNGIFLSENQICELNFLLDKSTVFRFSIDGIEEKTLKSIRPGYYKTDVSNTIKKIDELGYSSVFTTIITNQSAQEIINIANFLNNLKHANRWNLRPAVPVGTDAISICDNWERISSIYEAVLEWYKNKQHRLNFVLGNVISSFYLEHPNAMQQYVRGIHPCKSEKNQKTIKASGKITQCPMLSELNNNYLKDKEKYTYRNINIPFCNDLETNRMPCLKCRFFVLCGGGCRLYSIAQNGNIEGCDVNSRMTLSWVIQDSKKLFQTYWKEYYAKVKAWCNV